MNISVTSIRRPVLAIVFSILIVLIGVVGASFLGIRQFPDVDPPQINVTTTYLGANADVIESQITEPLEESINGIDGIRSLTSTSNDGRANITVEFELGRDLEQAANDVRDRVDRVKRSLPADVDPPVVAKADANGQAIVVMTVQSNKRSLTELTDYAVNVLKERVQTISGVGGVQIWGERKYAMRVQMDPNKLSAYGLTTVDVRTALQRENVELPAGRLEGANTELSIRTLGRLSTVEQFEEIILENSQGAVVHLGDVARVYLGAENERTILKRDGIPMIGLALSPQPGANQVDIADEFYRRVAALKNTVPEDIQLDVAFDNTQFIRTAIGEVEETLIIAFSLVVIIIFLFLRSWRATLIPVIAIPVSLISSFFFLWIAGFSINILTLLGIVLATGLVVDDAIVVMENIFKRIEHGQDPTAAGEEGSTEITFAVVSTTITLAVVFLPIIFLQGLTGALFREFGLVVASSVVVSAFVSLTLTPMMSTRLLRQSDSSGWLVNVTEPFFVWLNTMYAKTVNVVITKPFLAIVVMLVAGGSIYLVGGLLKSELAPLEDRGLMNINLTAPEGTSFDRMDVIIDSLQDRVSRLVPEKKLLLTVTSPSFQSNASNTGFGRLILKPSAERTRSQMQLANMLTQATRNATEARSVIIQEQTISTGGRAGLPIQFVLQAPQLSDLQEVVQKFIDKASANKTFSIVDVNLKFSKPEVTVEIDRDRARNAGISVFDIATTLQTGFSGQRFGYIIRNGKQYQILGELERESRSTPEQLSVIPVRTGTGAIMPLSDLVTIREQSSPPALYRYNRNVSATISAGLVPGATVGDGIAAMNDIAKELLDERFSTALTGPSRDFVESSSSLLFAFLLALTLVYLILAAQFESWLDPFTIMLTVPLALTGAVLSLWATGETLNIFSQIGCIVLIGLVTKNGILIVEFANQRVEDGLSYTEAAKESARLRFRPILMTSLATILGALPIALSLGAASESRVGLGVVVVGGMSIATFLTLYIIPALYVIISKGKRHVIHPPHHIPTTWLILVVAIPSLLFATPAASQTQQNLSPLPTPLTVNDALKIALERNLQIQIAKGDSSIAQITEDGSLAPLLPTLDINAGTTRGANNVSQTTSSGLVIERNGATFSNMNAAALLQWTLFDGLQMFATKSRIEYEAKSLKEQTRSRIATIAANVLTQYAALVATNTQYRTVEKGLELAQKRLTLVEQRKAVGTAHGVDVSQAIVDKNTVQALLTRARTEQRNAMSGLLSVMNYPVQDTVNVPLIFDIPTVPPQAELLTVLAQQNPDVVAAVFREQVAEQQAREAGSLYWPRLIAQGGYQYTNNTAQAGFILENQTMGWNIGLALQYNIFNGFRDSRAHERALVAKEQQRLQTLDAINLATTQLVQAYRTLEQGKELLALEQTSYDAAQKNAQVALEQYTLGMNTDLEVRQTQQSVIEIGNRIARLQFETYTATVEVLRLSGKLVQ